MLALNHNRNPGGRCLEGANVWTPASSASCLLRPPYRLLGVKASSTWPWTGVQSTLLLLVLLHSWAVHHFHCLHISIVTVQLDISMKFVKLLNTSSSVSSVLESSLVWGWACWYKCLILFTFPCFSRKLRTSSPSIMNKTTATVL